MSFCRSTIIGIQTLYRINQLFLCHAKQLNYFSTKKQKIKKTIASSHIGQETNCFHSIDDPWGDTVHIPNNRTSQFSGKQNNDEFDFAPVKNVFEKEIESLKKKYQEIKLGRQVRGTFDAIPIQLPSVKDNINYHCTQRTRSKNHSQSVILSDISEITIKTSTLTIIRLFEPTLMSSVITGIQTYNKMWSVVQQSSDIVHIIQQQTTKELRDLFCLKVKTIGLECLDNLSSIQGDCVTQIKEAITVKEWGLKEIKTLKKLFEGYCQEAKQETKKKVDSLSITS